MVDTIITNGKIVTPNSVLHTDLAIEDGKIAAVGDKDTFDNATTQIDATDRYVMPGVVDPHVHLQCYYSNDTYETGTKAAALGGVTTCIAFAWQAWKKDQADSMSVFEEDGTLIEAINRHKNRGKDAVVDFALHGGITRSDPDVFDELEEAVSEGVTSFKMFTAYEISISNGFLDQLFVEIADQDAVAVLHTEDNSICEARTEQLKKEGKADPTHYPSSRPDYSEAIAADSAARMAKAAGVKYYGFHTSSKAAVDALERHHEDGSQIRAETCTHYTTLDDSVYETMGMLPIIAPPIRKRSDIEAMFESLDSGLLSVVSSDHTVFKREEKEVDEWWNCKFGANSVQRSLPVFHDEAIIKREFSYPFLVQVMCTNPARTFGLKNKGTLEPGTDADVIIFDPEATQMITAEDNASVSDFSVYEGRDVTGRVETTLVRGEIVADDGEIVADSGYGNYCPRVCPDWD